MSMGRYLIGLTHSLCGGCRSAGYHFRDIFADIAELSLAANVNQMVERITSSRAVDVRF